MIGSIPSYTDSDQFLSDENLYPQNPPMYNFRDQQFATNNPGASSYPEAQYESAQYDLSYGGNGQEFRQGSFADVGAAFGFHPDLPIQISSQNLPQSSLSYTGLSQPFHAPNVGVDMGAGPASLFPSMAPGNAREPQPGQVNVLSDHDGFEQGGWHSRRPTSPGSHQGKRQRRSQEDSDDEEAHRRPTTRLPGACVHCKTLKVKCEFIPGHDVCNRCRAGKKECIVMGRKPRRPPPKREDLLNKIREQESTINDLRARLEAVHIAPSPESALSPSSDPQSHASPHSQPYSHTNLSNSRTGQIVLTEEPVQVQNKAIQEWINNARISASSTTAAADLDPRAVSVDAEEQEGHGGEYDDEAEPSGEEDGGEGGGEGETTKSPAVGTSLSPIGMIARSALRTRPKSVERRRSTTSTSANEAEPEELGVANASYFMPGISTNPELRWAVRESQPPPRILASSLVSPREVDKLFEIFFDRMNLSVSLLDPVIYTAQTTYWRSPFLFTVICAIASRYLTERDGLYPVLMNFAKIEAGQALVAGLKSPELVAGYILLSLYPVPSTRWEEDRGWLMLGVAIRMATDLNLHHSATAKITTPQQAREVANRTRIWINCYNLDRSTSTQFGKPSTIKEDYIARHYKFWYRNTGFNYDIHLNGYTQLLRVMARFHEAIYSDPDAPSGLNKAIDFESVTEKYEQELLDHWTEWEPRFHEEADNTNLHCLYRIELLRLANAYSRLVILSFRFQNAFQNGLGRGDPFLQRCLDTASDVVKIVVDRMAPHPFLRTAPDAQFVFASFASVFLLKLLRPRFASVLEQKQKDDIVTLIARLIDVLQSDKVAIDERHTPKLYARFLAGLLERHMSSSSRSSRGSEQPAEIEERSRAYPAMEQQQAQPPPPPPLTPQFTLSAPPNEGNRTQNTFVNMHPVYQPLMVPPSSSRNALNSLNAYANNDGASSVSETIAARSHAGSGPSVPDSIMTTNPQTYEDDGMLATMRAITNPTFWEDMMMPGFSWTPLEPQPEFLQQYVAS